MSVCVCLSFSLVTNVCLTIAAAEIIQASVSTPLTQVTANTLAQPAAPNIIQQPTPYSIGSSTPTPLQTSQYTAIGMQVSTELYAYMYYTTDLTIHSPAHECKYRTPHQSHYRPHNTQLCT